MAEGRRQINRSILFNDNVDVGVVDVVFDVVVVGKKDNTVILSLLQEILSTKRDYFIRLKRLYKEKIFKLSFNTFFQLTKTFD